MHTFFLVLKIILACLFMLAGIETIKGIGRKRYPITHSSAVRSVLLVAILVIALFH